MVIASSRLAAKVLPLFMLLAGCAAYDPQPPAFDYRFAEGAPPLYAGGRYGALEVGGDGAAHLDPWLSDTRPGKRLVLAYFDHNANGRIGLDRAGEANRWFRRYADRDGNLRLTDREINRGLIALDHALRRADN